MPFAFVALDDADHFRGCVRADRARGTVGAHFPYARVGPDDLLLSSLCVDHTRRGGGVGRQLVDAVVAAAGAADTQLFIAKLSEAHVARLRGVYAAFGFEYCGETARYVLMCRRRGGGTPAPAACTASRGG